MCRRTRAYATRPRDVGLRTSQAERDEVVERLREHAGEGRLELDELEERVDAALRARTRGELESLLADLPDQGRRRAPTGAWRAVALGSAAAALLPLVVAIALLALAPPAFAWMAWPLLGWWFFAGLPAAGVGVVSCGVAKRRRDRTVVV